MYYTLTCNLCTCIKYSTYKCIWLSFNNIQCIYMYVYKCSPIIILSMRLLKGYCFKRAQLLIGSCIAIIHAAALQWRIQGGGGDLGVRTPPSASTSLIIHYSQSTYDSLHDTAQIAPAPSKKTITGAASTVAAMHLRSIERSEQSAGLRYVRTRTHARSHTYPQSAHAQKIYKYVPNTPFH